MKEFNDKCEEWADMTDRNAHTNVLLDIAYHFYHLTGDRQILELLGWLVSFRLNNWNYLSSPHSAENRLKKMKELLDRIKVLYGSGVYEQVKNCL